MCAELRVFGGNVVEDDVKVKGGRRGDLVGRRVADVGTAKGTM